MTLTALLLAILSFAGGLEEASQNRSQEKEKKEETGLHETVVVTASRTEQPLVEAISSVTILDREELLTSPHLVLDEQLRRIPGFSLFRRTSSLVAHPTTQGVSLRGIGPSGTSRSLVLFDGIPLNDPFGGWIYWNRIPSLLLNRIEVARGASSQLYGSSALGGTIQMLSQRPRIERQVISAEVGSKDTVDLNAGASGSRGNWAYSLAGRIFDTGGYFVLDEDLRGQVDVPANVEFQNLFGRVYYKDFHVGVNAFHEDRSNGTRLQTNSSKLYLVEGGVVKPDWRLNFYTQSGVLQSQFSRILPDRSQEFVTANQRFESTGLGGSFQWRLQDSLLVGTDWRHVRWDDQNQNLLGIYLQDRLPLSPRLDLVAGARLDWWENQSFQTSLNPRAGLLFRHSDNWTFRGSLYRGFRAPTLNELYRPFRVGNVITSANPELGAESLWGIEGGSDFHPSGDLLLRFNAFWNRLEDPVGNVTLSVTPDQVLRQRQNLDSATIGGVELEAQYRISPIWELSGAYLLSEATVTETGLRLPQVPRHQATAGVAYRGPLTASAEARWMGSQFEDDLNEFELGSFVTFDLFLRRALTEELDLFVALENLLDRRFAVGRTPLERLGQPRLIHGGIRLNLNR